MKWKIKIVQKEDGYSLVESLIAMSILLAVLVPSTMFLTYVGNNVIAKDKITSFNYARNQMETTLAIQNDSSFTKKLDSNWWVRKSVTKHENLREIKVEVFKKDTLSDPMITLQTARQWYSEN